MATRLPASQRTREELTALIEGRLSTASAKDELVKLATRLIVEETLDRGLLIDTENDRLGGRIDVQAHDIGGFRRKLGSLLSHQDLRAARSILCSRRNRQTY
jgi:hypothetical protein